MEEAMLSKIVITGLILIATIYIWNKWEHQIRSGWSWIMNKIDNNQSQQPQSFGGGYIDPNETDYYKIAEQRWGMDTFNDE